MGDTGAQSRAITITQANNITCVGSNGGIFLEFGIVAYAQLGHGGGSTGGNQSGAITITQVNDLNFLGGEGLGAYAQLGHGGIIVLGDLSVLQVRLDF